MSLNISRIKTSSVTPVFQDETEEMGLETDIARLQGLLAFHSAAVHVLFDFVSQLARFTPSERQALAKYIADIPMTTLAKVTEADTKMMNPVAQAYYKELFETEIRWLATPAVSPCVLQFFVDRVRGSLHPK